MPDLHEFSGMPGVRAKKLKGPMVGSPSGAIAALRKHRICSSAGDHGATNVYIDDDGKYRCQFMRFHRTVNEATFTSQADVRAWLKEWMSREKERPDA